MKKVSFVALFLCFLFYGGTVFAVDTTKQQAASQLKQTKEELLQLKQKMAQEKCQRIESRVRTRVTNYQEDKVRRINAFRNMQSRIKKIQEKLTQKGYDTTKLSADIVVLDQKINKLSLDYEAYIGLLTESQAFACGKSEGEFLDKLGGARNQLKIINAESKEIKSFFGETIKSDLQSLKNMIGTKTNTGNSSSSTNNTTNEE